MRQLIQQNGRVGYGCIDEPILFNYEDFPLRTFFGRKVGRLRRRLALGSFTYLGILGEGWLVGLAAVRLGYAANVFGYFFDFATGEFWEHSVKDLPGRLHFPLDPDECSIQYDGRTCRLDLAKSHARETLEVEARFGGRLEIKGRFPFGFGLAPLRVVNPSCGDPNRFTFTEKCSPLVPTELSVKFDGAERSTDPGKAAALSDWSAGFFNRNTNWLWSAFAAVLPDGTAVGANFAALVNESYYPENAFWVDGRRVRLAQVIFDYDPEDPRRAGGAAVPAHGRARGAVAAAVPEGELQAVLRGVHRLAQGCGGALGAAGQGAGGGGDTPFRVVIDWGVGRPGAP